ncbi:sensor histidine kinase [Anaeromicropila herbilytica]|nr:HAMP domain-containing sensor histidine kinase [Anaeromicropila herbilytica]
MEQSFGFEPSELLKCIANDTVVENEKIFISQDTLKKLMKGDSWIQILNEEGQELYSYHKPEIIQSSYAPGELLSYRKAENLSGYKIYTWFKKVSSQKLTWIYGTSYHYDIKDDYRLWIGVAILCIVILFGVAILFGIQLGKPVLYILAWIENISKGIYQEPIRNNRTPIFRNSNNQLRRSYKTHEELIQAMESLSCNLKENDIKREKLEQSREEWIAGVSHDMRTPLSSVKGYANLLASEQYTYDQKEVRMYAEIISDKAAYMEDLIEDLSLTFALSNNALPINLQTKNLVEIVRRSIIDLLNNGVANQIKIDFLNKQDDEILYPIDEKWFKRIIDNLLWNAISHNECGTTITIAVNHKTDEWVRTSVDIEISDNGKGMEKELLEHIFDRYYRGTNTSEEKVKGSGLGTAIAKQLIEAHGGIITVNSELDKGTTFMVHLPERKLSLS